ncbi:MAG: hypothetical protein J2P20_00675, partial [Pseudonocardia sp.]|nr:hypothetical protein [Pseudonocardia sp.]
MSEIDMRVCDVAGRSAACPQGRLQVHDRDLVLVKHLVGVPPVSAERDEVEGQDRKWRELDVHSRGSLGESLFGA